MLLKWLGAGEIQDLKEAVQEAFDDQNAPNMDNVAKSNFLFKNNSEMMNTSGYSREGTLKKTIFSLFVHSVSFTEKRNH